jgi:phage shock protein B
MQDLADGISVVMIVFVSVVVPIWLFLHYGWRWRQAKLLTTENERSLADLVDLADQLTTRIDNLERLLDASAPEWRKTP